MLPARIAELLAPFLASAPTPNICHSESGQRPGEEPAFTSAANDQRLTTNDLERISTYIDILLRWNARINLTAIRDPEEIVTRHFGESLFAARHLFPYETHTGTSDTNRAKTPDKNHVGTTKKHQAGTARKNYVGTAAPGCPAERSSAVFETHAVQGGRAALQGRVKDEEKYGVLAPDAAAINEQSATNKQRAAERRQNTAHTCPEGSRSGASREITDQAPEGRKITVADIGSGAGFPGIPIKLWAPQISLTLIESNHKKATFLREVTRALTLTDINIQTTRAESLIGFTYDLVTLRAVERFETILPVAANLVAPGRRLAVLVGSSQLEQARSRLPELSWADLPIPSSRSRVLAVAYRSV